VTFILISRHAFPFNAEPEFMDKSLFVKGLEMAQDLVSKSLQLCIS